MKTYSQWAKKEGKAAAVLSVGLLAAGFLCLAAARFFPGGRGVGQFFAVVLLSFFIQLSSRYLFTEYRYEWEEDTLFFFEKRGKRIRSMGGITVNGDSLLFTNEEWKREKKSHPVSKRFSYHQNIFSKNRCFLLSRQNEEAVLVCFEPDEALLSLIRERL